MKNFTYKTLLKYCFCAFAFFTLNQITFGVPFSISLLPAFFGLRFSPVATLLIFFAVNLFKFSLTQCLLLFCCGVILAIIYKIYKVKNKKIKGEIIIYLCIALTPYVFGNFEHSIYAKLIYSAIICAFAIIFTLAFKVIFVGKFQCKSKPYERASFYLFTVVFSLGLIEIFGIRIYEIIAITTTLFLCRFYKNSQVFIPAFLLPVSLSLYSQSFAPLALFEIYCAVVLLFINRSVLLSAIALVITRLAVSYISGDLFTFVVSDYLLTFLPIVIFLFFPDKLIERIKNLFYSYQEHDVIREVINYERANLSLKLNELSCVFGELENSLNLFDELILSKQNLTDKIVEECLLNVCALCPFYTDCLRQNHPKKEDLLKLINLGISKGKLSLIDISRDFSLYCYSVNTMLYEINRLLNEYNEVNENGEKIQKFKKLTCMQASAISVVLNQLSYSVASKIQFNQTLEKQIFEALAQEGIMIKQLLFVNEECHIIFAKSKINFQAVSKILSSILKKDMRLQIKTDVNNAIFAIFSKSPPFDASFGIAQHTKKQSVISGDCHTMIKINEGCFLVALCDGMGSGEKARKNSQTAINLFETLYKAGLPKENVLDVANRLLCVCSEDSFATIDCAVIDLFNGNCDCIKVGATYGFLMGENNIKIIENDCLPLGILEEVEPNFTSLPLEDSNTLILLSDGVTDAFFSSADTIDFLERERGRNPQTLANKILDYAYQNYGGEAKDDMTVIVVNIYKSRS